METLEPKNLLAGDPVISEFQAINDSTLADEDGDFSDWIEIRNPEATPVDIGGWYLTDDAADLTKWQIPAGTVLPASDEIIVFASDKDRSDGPSGELHTNFRLSGGGEYLALVKADGVSVSHFYETYPEQTADQSFGLATGRDIFQLIEDNAPTKALVPTDNSLAQTWTATDFDDASWVDGTQGVGYETLSAGFSVTNAFDEPLGPEWQIDMPEGATGNVSVTGGNLVFDIPTGNNMEFGERGTAPIVSRPLPNDSVADFELMTHVTQLSSNRGMAGLVVLDGESGEPAVQFEYSSRLNFRLIAGGETQDTDTELSEETYFLRLVRNSTERTWTASFKILESDDWTDLDVITDGVDGVPTTINSPRVGVYVRTPSDEMNASVDFFDINVPDQAPVYGPHLGLDVGAAMAGVNSSVYMRIPFTLDVDPATLDEMDLSANFDDGFAAYLNGVPLTTAPGEPLAENVPIDATWDSAATAEFGATAGAIPLRTFNVATALGALQQGQNVLAIHGVNAASDDADFFFRAELSAADVLDSSPQPFTTPTPGESNELPAAPTPVISGKQGLFFGSTEVTIELPEPIPTLAIHYTTDGSVPNESSALYTGPITLTTSAMLQAVAIDTSGNPAYVTSNQAAATFIAVESELQSATSNLPMLILDGFGSLAGAGGTSLTAMNAVMVDLSKATGLSALDSAEDNIEYIGRAGARDRGSSTSGQSKPNMTFETWGPEGTNKDDDDDVGWLGLNPEADWVLHAPFSFDRALIRNQIAFDLSNQMGMWATNYRHIEVYIDGGRGAGDGIIDERDFQGVYVLIEKIEQGNGRIDISDTDASSVVACVDTANCTETGSFILKVDRSDPDAPAFNAGGQNINWVYPKSPRSSTARDDQKATQAQQDQIVDYYNAFRGTLSNPDISDPEGYSKYIDPVSWVDHHMLNVFLMNVDALRLSAYMYKDAGERITYGPVWDFDRSAESNDGRDDDPFVWRSETGDLGTDFFGNGTQRFWGDLFEDPGFWQLYIDRWQMWRDSVLSDESVGALIDGMVEELGPAAIRNHERISSSRPRSTSGYPNNVLDGTFQGEIENLKLWLRERAQFMDDNFAQRAELLGLLPDGEKLSPAADGALVTPGTTLTLNPPALPFNVDEVLIDGTAGAVNARYIAIGDDELGDSWTANDFDATTWSEGPLGIGFENSPDDFDELIKTQFAPATQFEGSTTTLIRVDFDIDDVARARELNLILKMKYDDGFVAYINGQRVHDQNLRDDELAWNSRARSHRDSEAVLFEDFDISAGSQFLVQGKNTLAIRGINSSATSNDMLMLPELLLREVKFGVNPDARVYYTTDGTDPRGPDGQPSTSAILLQGGGDITITDNTRIIARNFDESFRGPESVIVRSDWSGPIEYNLVVSDATTLVMSEINYNPTPATDAEQLAGYGSDDFEWIELHNRGNAAIDLDGIKLTDGVDVDLFGAGSIPAGGYGVVVANAEAFQSRYPGVPILAQYTGNLDNNGEDIDLRNGAGQVIASVNYGDADPWPIAADGFGSTLVLKTAQTGVTLQGKWYSWRAGVENGGTPGAASAEPVGIVVNEILSRTEAPVTDSDSIELHNTTDVAVDLSGWFLSDSANNLFAYEIPAGSIIGPGGYLVFNESNFNAADDTEGFGLNGTDGDNVYLVRGTKAAATEFGGTVSHFVDAVDFRETLNGETLGRVPNGSGRLAPLNRSTLGAANVDPRVGPLLISEVAYNPSPSEAALAADPSLEDSDLEFIEIHNPTAAAIDLTDWRIRGGGDYNFDDGTVLPAGGYIVVLKFNPDDPENVNQVNAFRAHYGIGPEVTLVGGYAGQLNNSDDQVLLLRPDVSVQSQRPRVQEDEVMYDDLQPWPIGADGALATLQRASLNGFGNDPASWVAAIGTPGGPIGNTPVVGDSNGDGVFNSSDLVAVFVAGEYEDAIAGNSTFEDGDWDGDGDFTTSDLVFAFTFGNYSLAARRSPEAAPEVAKATDDAIMDDSLLSDLAAAKLGDLDDDDILRPEV